jgi:hypothetical protein
LRTPRRRADQRRDRRRRPSMSTLVAIGYSDPYKAEEVRLMLRRMQK